MSNFYVVSQVSPDADGYASAIVFDNTNETVDNEAAANEYLTEAQTLRPWQTHSVVSADEFADKFDKEPDDVNNVSLGKTEVPADADTRTD